MSADMEEIILDSNFLQTKHLTVNGNEFGFDFILGLGKLNTGGCTAVRRG